MPVLVAADAAPHRDKEALKAHRESLKPVLNAKCGHVGISAAEYYMTPRRAESAQWQTKLCLECYRRQEKIRQKMRKGKLTIEDLRNIERPSGFDHVRFGTGKKPYQANKYGGKSRGNGSGSGVEWTGKRRSTADEAAQDYCNFINGTDTAAPTRHTYDAVVVELGTSLEPKFQGGQKAQGPRQTRKHEPDVPQEVYDVLLYNQHDGRVIRRKVGYTKRGKLRYNDMAITWGFSIKPVKKAVLVPNLAEAIKLEREYIDELAADTTHWLPVGQECFAPRLDSNVKAHATESTE